MTTIEIRPSELSRELSNIEKLAIIEAWEDYTCDAPVVLNESNPISGHLRGMIISSLDTAFFAATQFVSSLMGPVDLDEEDDYELVVKDMVRTFKKMNIGRIHYTHD